MLRLRIALSLLAVLSLSFGVRAQEEGEEAQPAPGRAVRERAAADARLLLPQIGLGGSEKMPLNPELGEVKQIKVAFEGEGADKLKAWVALPQNVDKSRKHALVFAFMGAGDEDTKEDIKQAAAINQARDPVVVCALEYRFTRPVDERTAVIEYCAPEEVRQAACLKLLQTMLKEHNIDPQRVFLLEDWAGQEALDWSRQLWETDPDAFPFRAIIINGTVTAKAEELPPVPYVFGIEEEMLKRLKGDQAAYNPRNLANALMARGSPCQFHAYKSALIGATPRWQMIMRDAVNRLGGPGAVVYPEQLTGANVVTEADAVPFGESKDPHVSKVVELAKQERWSEAWKYMKDTLADKNLKPKDKKPLQDFQKEWDKYLTGELDRLNKSIEASIKANMWSHNLHRARLTAMVEAFKDEKWCKGKPYAANIEKLKTYPPAEREKVRREKLTQAIDLEITGERDKAKALYTEVAKGLSEDGGHSESAKAAKYRLDWWTDVK